MLNPPNPPDALLTTGTSIQTTYQKTGDNTGTTTLFKIKRKNQKKMYKKENKKNKHFKIPVQEYSKAHA